MRQRRTGAAGLLLLILTVLILGGAWLYTTWQSSQTVLPPGLTINGLPMGGMTREQALQAIQLAYTTPISVTYAGEVIPPLLPEMIELTLDVEATTENLEETLASEETLVRDFMEYILDRLLQREPQSYEVTAVVSYSRERVNAFLERTAQKYDHPPQESVALPEAGTFRPARDGTELDVDASLPLLIEAILAAESAERQVELVVDVTPAPPSSTSILAQALEATLQDFGGIAGIYTKELQSGQELCFNCKLAYSGMGTLKMGIALKLYEMDDDTLEGRLRTLMTAMLTEDDDAATDALLSEIGASDPYSGALEVTDFLWRLSLANTFLVIPYTAADTAPAAGAQPGTLPPPLVTEANSRPDLLTAPDPYRQTTPLEMALLLEGVQDCAQGGGFLRVLHPQDVTPAECQDLLMLAESNGIDSPLSGGFSPATRILHKTGWDGDTYADVALIHGERASFVLAVFLYQPEWEVWEESVPTFTTVGQLVYRFFEGE